MTDWPRPPRRGPHSGWRRGRRGRRLVLEPLEKRYMLAVFSVTTTTDVVDPDDDLMSLREAIIGANLLDEPNTIVFNLEADDPGFEDADSGSGLPGADAEPDVFVIRPTTDLPEIGNSFCFCEIVVDGLSQATFADGPGESNPFGPEVVIESGGPLAAVGLTIGNSGQIRGLNVRGFASAGIQADGIFDAGIFFTDVRIDGNYIGTDATGRQRRPNGLGIVATNLLKLEIGSGAEGIGNLISGNVASGIQLTGQIVEVRLGRSLIGTDASGLGDLGNGGHGVEVLLEDVPPPAIPLPVSSVDLSRRNVVAFNALDGYFIATQNNYPVAVPRGDLVFGNGGLGINLFDPDDGPTGVTQNDDFDADAGPNDFLNFPEITAVRRMPGSTVVEGSLQTDAPDTEFFLDFYASAARDASGFGEGERYLGSTSVTTDGTGRAVFTTPAGPLSPVGPTEWVTAVTTRFGNSEFSRAVQPGPSIEIADAQVLEGDSGESNLVFEVTLLRTDPGGVVTVNFATADDTASEGIDYRPVAGTVTFPPGGASTQTITVPVLGDTTPEADETLFILLSGAEGADLSGDFAEGVILNDDLPRLSIGDVEINEGDTGSINLVFTVGLSGSATEDISISYLTENGTATAGQDYVSQSGSVLILPGQSSVTISVPVLGDLIEEENETFFVRITDTGGRALIVDPVGIGRIDNDDNSFVVIGPITIDEGDSGTVVAMIPLQLSRQSELLATVNYATDSNGLSATPGVDYLATMGTVTFLPGETTGTATVEVVGDLLDELDEQFQVRLSNLGRLLVQPGEDAVVVTIADDDLASVSIADVSLAEGNSGSAVASFEVRLTQPLDRPLVLNFSARDITARNGEDFLLAPAELTLAAGLTTATISASILGDRLVEQDETFEVVLSGATLPVRIDDDTALGTILNDDQGTVSVGDAQVVEGDDGTADLVFPIRLSQPLADGATVVVVYETVPGSATPGEDHLPVQGTLTFLPGGAIEQEVTVMVLGDTEVEPDETVLLRLVLVTGGVADDRPGVGTILNGDVEEEPPREKPPPPPLPQGPPVITIFVEPLALVLPVRREIVLLDDGSAGLPPRPIALALPTLVDDLDRPPRYRALPVPIDEGRPVLLLSYLADVNSALASAADAGDEIAEPETPTIPPPNGTNGLPIPRAPQAPPWSYLSIPGALIAAGLIWNHRQRLRRGLGRLALVAGRLWRRQRE